jgi:GTPase SAR1 family protein
MVLVGNKIDLKERAVSVEMAENKASKMRIPYIECSAFTGQGINKIFNTLCKVLV